MRPSMLMGAGGLPPAEFVGSYIHEVIGTATVGLGMISGLRAGDYVLMFASTNSSPTQPDIPGWDRENHTWGPGYTTTTYRRRITSPASFVVSGWAESTLTIVAFRGATRSARRSIAGGGSLYTSLTLAGVTRQPDCVGLMSVLSDRQAGLDNFTVSSGWTRRAIQTVGNFRMSTADVLPRLSYVDGTSLTWGALGGNYVGGQLYELLR